MSINFQSDTKLSLTRLRVEVRGTGLRLSGDGVGVAFSTGITVCALPLSDVRWCGCLGGPKTKTKQAAAGGPVLVVSGYASKVRVHYTSKFLIWEMAQFWDAIGTALGFVAAQLLNYGVPRGWSRGTLGNFGCGKWLLCVLDGVGSLVEFPEKGKATLECGVVSGPGTSWCDQWSLACLRMFTSPA